ncbi:hotdog fold thioesterase [Streptomyces sp. NBC_00247]|uniref:hotdog fold thioesterase n=1 Tax=Streptomyces sp. NBC_00247 TaxID=2975689 RepID=UPI002E2C3684|nr:hotdog fold thioesterase [Streptomyces sp. NBC_00247]
MPVNGDYVHEQLTQRLGIDIVTCVPGLVMGTMPVAGNRQPIGILHGGANAAFAETLGSVAAFLYAGPGGNAVGIDLSCVHHRWVSSGTLRGTATPLAERRSMATYDISIRDELDQRVCTARLTCAIRRPRPRGRTPRDPRR